MGTNCGGWGQYWGSIPWGGSVCPEPPPSGGLGFPEGWERVRRYPREVVEHVVRNVLFAIHGLRIKAKLGTVAVFTGAGANVHVFAEAAPSTGAVAKASVAAGTNAHSETCASSCVLGRVEVRGDSVLLLAAHFSSTAKLGAAQVSASTAVRIVRPRRGLTDEEILMMLAGAV